MSESVAATNHVSRPRILFLAQTLPFPPDGGVKIRTYNILRLLARDFDVTALCFYRRAITRDVEAAGEALTRFARVEAFPIPQEHAPHRLLWDHARSVARRRTYTAYAYESAQYRTRLRQFLRSESFDLVHADSLDLSGYFGELGSLPVVCVHHDAQSLLLKRRAEHDRALWRRAYLRHQAALMAREEAYWCPRVALNVVVSAKDRDYLAGIAPGARLLVVPNGVDTTKFQPSVADTTGSIVFVGGATWAPNLDGMGFFAEKILPLLRARGITAPVEWVGRIGQATREHFANSGVDLVGFVEDIRPTVSRARCYIVPLRIGGGTRIKILDAWAMGKAIVTTTIGCEGLAAVDGENALIRDTPEAFADAICAILNDSELRSKLGSAGRRTVEQSYGWAAIGDEMNRAYRAVIDDTRVDAQAPRNTRSIV